VQEEVILRTAGMFSFFLGDQLSDTFDLLTEIPRGPEDAPLTSDNELDHAVGGSDCGAVASADADRDFFDVLVGGLRFFCIHNVDVVIFLDFLDTSRNLVGIEDNDDADLPESLIIAQDVHELVAGRIDIDGGKLTQLVPCKDDVVAVDEKIFVFRLLFLF